MDEGTMVVVFRSRLRDDVDVAAYERHASALLSEAEQMPGFRSIKDFGAEDGERLAVIEFASEPELEARRDHAEHRLAQQSGRDRYYTEYRLQVCRLARESTFHLEG